MTEAKSINLSPAKTAFANIISAAKAYIATRDLIANDGDDALIAAAVTLHARLADAIVSLQTETKKLAAVVDAAKPILSGSVSDQSQNGQSAQLTEKSTS